MGSGIQSLHTVRETARIGKLKKGRIHFSVRVFGLDQAEMYAAHFHAEVYLLRGTSDRARRLSSGAPQVETVVRHRFGRRRDAFGRAVRRDHLHGEPLAYAPARVVE